MSWFVNGATGRIAMASCVAFACAGIVDALVYHTLRDHGALVKINGSNVLSAIVDSLVFPTLAFGAVLPLVIVGQIIAKIVGGAGWSMVLTQRLYAVSATPRGGVKVLGSIAPDAETSRDTMCSRTHVGSTKTAIAARRQNR